MTALLALMVVAQALAALGMAVVLSVRLVMPVSPSRTVAAWWRRRIVAVMAPVPGWSPA